ncbi:MAG: DUF2130 domain-containing protein [Bradyrhizobium sp.]
MTDGRIVCPKCFCQIKLTDSLVGPWIEKAQKHSEARQKKAEAEFQKREFALQKSQLALTKARAEIDDEISSRLRAERHAIAEAETKKARLALVTDLKRRNKKMIELQEDLRAKNGKLAAAQKARAEVMRKSRELDDARRELDLSVERRVQESLVTVREQAKSEIEDRFKVAVTEREIQIVGMRRQIEDLRRSAEQSSQQLQGEALEVELESALRHRFPTDLFEPVTKGLFGGDLIHRVVNPSGQVSGTILWECKRTKSWSDRWLKKARLDQRSANADVVLIVSSTLPSAIRNFDLIENVWVTQLGFSLPLATALRQSLIDTADGGRATEGHRSKMELVYKYLTGVQFKQRIEGIVERFTDMRQDLARERIATMRIWAKREAQLQAVLDGSAGLYGDIEGIVGRAMPEIQQLDLQLIADSKPDPR